MSIARDHIRTLTTLHADDTAVDVEIDDGRAQFTLFLTEGRTAPLSEVVPIFEGLGIHVIEQHPTTVELDGARRGRVLVFDTAVAPSGDPENDLEDRLAAAFAAVWRGEAENDALNSLVATTRLSIGEITVLRAYVRYLRQTPIGVTTRRIIDILTTHPEAAVMLVALFTARHNPDPTVTPSLSPDCAAIEDTLTTLIDDVAQFDADRVLRALLALTLATVRTTYFATRSTAIDRDCITLKFDPRSIDFLPAPRPRFEVFVYSPRVEGVHMRLDAIARGGLRWSDRHDDFRTEILGLVKAQSVKNSVIVPGGAKGGFVVKRPPTPSGDPAADRQAAVAEGIECYRMFISALLRVTDNRDVTTGTVIPAPGLVRHDGEDSYLVVAADKGTATFSDIANELSIAHGFWLGDAFASGGSVGYDHKAMGITARGAWISVRRHLRERGIDVDRDEFTVVGIGDMSGDVFGNGMLLSPHIRLVAAFNHRHIFIDPDPDAARSEIERRRLFTTPGSAWSDYRRSEISHGGGFFDRSAKSIPVTAQMRSALALPVTAPDSMSPATLISHILRAPVDLLWNGGIGTYIKASDESHLDVADKSNDAIRVDASALRCGAVGEGGNLGVTQRGRIEFAMSGGKINTDALDNSAGVNCSDHEVNIKILLDTLPAASGWTADQRRAVLASMTDTVGRMVIADNHAHNELLGVSRAEALTLSHVYRRLLTDLENRGVLSRDVDALPADENLRRRIADRRVGLTSPELCTVMAQTKLAIASDLLADNAPGNLLDDDYFTALLADYFPAELVTIAGPHVRDHPLRRHIIATILTNRMVDHAGITFALRLHEEATASTADAIRSYIVAAEVFDLEDLWKRIATSGLPTSTTDELVTEARRVIDRAARWLLANLPQPLHIPEAIERFTATVRSARPLLDGWRTPYDRDNLADRTVAARDANTPAELIADIYGLLDQFCVLDIVEIIEIGEAATDEMVTLDDAGAVYFAVKDRVGAGRMLTDVSFLARTDRWNTLARLALREDLYSSARTLTADVLITTDPSAPTDDRIAEWERVNAARLHRSRAVLADLADVDAHDLATLSVAARSIRAMVSHPTSSLVLSR